MTPDDADGGEDGDSNTLLIVLAVIVAIPLVLIGVVVGSAVLGAFVLGVGEEPVTPPQATWQGAYDADAGTVTMTHDGGDSVQTDRIEVLVDGEPAADWDATDDRIDFEDEIVVYGVEGGEEVQIYWSEDGERSLIALHRAA